MERLAALGIHGEMFLVVWGVDGRALPWDIFVGCSQNVRCARILKAANFSGCWS